MCWTVLPSLAERQLTEPRCILYSHNADYWYNHITGDVVGLANTPTVVAKDGRRQFYLSLSDHVVTILGVVIEI